MKIGLLRHFKVVSQPVSGYISGEQFNVWVDEYNQSITVSEDNSISEHDWEMCICSDLPRAVHTAKQVYSGNHIFTKHLREIEIVAATSLTAIRLPRSAWLALGRMAWYLGHSSQPENRKETILRAQVLLEQMERSFGSASVLVVTHGAFMKVVAQQLLRKGYNGRRIFYPRNGELYVFEKEI